MITVFLFLNGFNPRTRKGCDIKSFHLLPVYPVSIHAPVKDATPVYLCNRLGFLLFQSTHP